MADERAAVHAPAPAPSPAPGIRRLPRPAASRLRASLVLPSFPRVLAELAQNALDAGATRIECVLSLVPEEESVRVEDDGRGIAACELGRVGEVYMTSKENTGLAPVEGYGFRGEALASIAALAMLQVTSRVGGHPTRSKVIKNGSTLYHGPARTDLGRPHGTTVVVRGLFNALPVRAAELAGESAKALAACRRAVEALALVHPAVRWVVWEERAGGGTRRLLAVPGSRRSVDAFRALYGSAGVERVQSVHVSSGSRRVDGFFSLEGTVTRAHQHLYVNGYPVETSGLHAAIAQRFAHSQFASMASNLTDDLRPQAHVKRSSPRRLERHPVYVLNITLPSADVDAAYEPGKTTLGYKEAGTVQSFVVTVVDDFLRQQGYGPRSTTASPTPSPRKRRREVEGRTEGALRRGKAAPRHALSISAPSPESDSAPETTADSPPLSALLHENANWVGDTLQNVDNELLPVRGGSLQPTTFLPLTDVSFPLTSLQDVHVLGQVDRKFVACTLRDARGREGLVVFDQHAADERAGVEGILDALCGGFARDDMPIKVVPEGVLQVVLTRAEREALSVPGVRDVLRRWGIVLSGSDHERQSPDGDADETSAGDYQQMSVLGFPSQLERLGKPAEMTRLLKVYLPQLAEGMGEMRALLRSLAADTQLPVDAAEPIPSRRPSDPAADGRARIECWMPPEMAELANSKACRTAIMFGDRLAPEQCERLLARLAGTRNPWVCAHGRPTLVPLRILDLGGAPARRRTINWSVWARSARSATETL